jgi:chromosome segregation ATPase
MDSVARLTIARQEIQEIKNLHKNYVESLQGEIKRMNSDLKAKTDQISSLLKEVGRQRAEIESLRNAADTRRDSDSSTRPNSRQYTSISRYPSFPQQYHHQHQHPQVHPSRYGMEMPPVVSMAGTPRNLQRSASSAAAIRPINSLRRKSESSSALHYS